MESRFFHKEIIDYLGSLSTKDFKSVLAITNGTLLTPSVVRRLQNVLKIPLKLIIDLDSIDKETYEKIRKNASFDQVMHNIYNINFVQNDKLVLLQLALAYENEDEIDVIKNYIKKFTTENPELRYYKVWHCDHPIFTKS